MSTMSSTMLSSNARNAKKRSSSNNETPAASNKRPDNAADASARRNQNNQNQNNDDRAQYAAVAASSLSSNEENEENVCPNSAGSNKTARSIDDIVQTAGRTVSAWYGGGVEKQSSIDTKRIGENYELFYHNLVNPTEKLLEFSMDGKVVLLTRDYIPSIQKALDELGVKFYGRYDARNLHRLVQRNKGTVKLGGIIDVRLVKRTRRLSLIDIRASTETKEMIAFAMRDISRTGWLSRDHVNVKSIKNVPLPLADLTSTNFRAFGKAIKHNALTTIIKNEETLTFFNTMKSSLQTLSPGLRDSESVIDVIHKGVCRLESRSLDGLVEVAANQGQLKNNDLAIVSPQLRMNGLQTKFVVGAYSDKAAKHAAITVKVLCSTMGILLDSAKAESVIDTKQKMVSFIVNTFEQRIIRRNLGRLNLWYALAEGSEINDDVQHVNIDEFIDSKNDLFGHIWSFVC